MKTPASLLYAQGHFLRLTDEKPMKLRAVKTNKMKNARTDGPFIQPAFEAVAPVEPEDLSGFEGEGGPEALEPAAPFPKQQELIDVN